MWPGSLRKFDFSGQLHQIRRESDKWLDENNQQTAVEKGMKLIEEAEAILISAGSSADTTLRHSHYPVAEDILGLFAASAETPHFYIRNRIREGAFGPHYLTYLLTCTVEAIRQEQLDGFAYRELILLLLDSGANPNLSCREAFPACEKPRQQISVWHLYLCMMLGSDDTPDDMEGEISAFLRNGADLKGSIPVVLGYDRSKNAWFLGAAPVGADDYSHIFLSITIRYLLTKCLGWKWTQGIRAQVSSEEVPSTPATPLMIRMSNAWYRVPDGDELFRAIET